MEDFVPYELAVKLKEKGFNDNCHAYYEPLKHCLNFSRVFKTNSLAENYKCVTAPAISQVLKWLREEKKIHIEILIGGFGWYYEVAFSINENDGLYEFYMDYPLEHHRTYELATIAGIEYCLDNLI